jgi:DNA repair protein RadC
MTPRISHAPSHTRDPTPSTEDLRITVELAEAGRLLDVPLLDHLVMGRERWVSLRALGALQPHAD